MSNKYIMLNNMSKKNIMEINLYCPSLIICQKKYNVDYFVLSQLNNMSKKYNVCIQWVSSPTCACLSVSFIK